MKVVPSFRLILTFLSLSLYLVTTSCSNDDDSSTNDDDSVSVDPNEGEAEEMLRLVNDIRTAEGLQPLVLNQKLNEAAFLHSKDMGDQNYFDHTGLDGSTFSERAKNAGYTGSPRGENIAAGNKTVAATFNQWFNSPGHLNNMLSSQSNEMGIGHAEVGGTQLTHYWTQIFGKSDASSLDSSIDNTPSTTLK